MLSILFVVFFLCMLIGIPIAFSIGIGSISSLLMGGARLLSIFPQRLWGGLDSFSLMAVPLFILAGKLMEEGGTSKRLVDFANLLVGRFRGGLAKTSVLASMIFAGISGSGSADTSAIGAIMIPALEKNGYKKGFIASLIAGGGTIGPIIPPSLLMIVYCTATGLSVGAMFFAGFVPGILMGISLMVVVHIYAKRHPEVDKESLNKKVSFKEALKVTWSASFALLMPVVIIGGIVFGVCTATEAAAIAILLAFIGGCFIYKEITFKDLPRILAEAAVTTSSVMMVVGMATVMGWILSYLQFPALITDVTMSFVNSKTMFLILTILLLSIIGTFMDCSAALLIFVPVLHPLCEIYGVHPIHFAVVCIIMLHIGTITPPVGVLLYIACSMANIKLSEALKYILPIFIALTTAAILTAFVPQTALALPQIFGLIT